MEAIHKSILEVAKKYDENKLHTVSFLLQEISRDDLEKLFNYYNSSDWAKYCVRMSQGLAYLHNEGSFTYLANNAMRCNADYKFSFRFSDTLEKEWHFSTEENTNDTFLIKMRFATYEEAILACLSISRALNLGYHDLIDLKEANSKEKIEENFLYRLDAILNEIFFLEIYKHFPKPLRALDRLSDLTTSPFSFAQWADLERINYLKSALNIFAVHDNHIYQTASQAIISYVNLLQVVEFAKYGLEDNRPIEELNSHLENLNVVSKAICDNDILCLVPEFSAYLYNRKAKMDRINLAIHCEKSLEMILEAIRLNPQRRYAKYFADYLHQLEFDNTTRLHTVGQGIFIDSYLLPCIYNNSLYLERIKELYPDYSKFDFITKKGGFACPDWVVDSFMKMPKFNDNPNFSQEEAQRVLQGKSGFPLDLLAGMIRFAQIAKDKDTGLASAKNLDEMKRYSVFFAYYIAQLVAYVFNDKNEYFHAQANSASNIDAEEVQRFEALMTNVGVNSNTSTFSYPHYINFWVKPQIKELEEANDRFAQNIHYHAAFFQ